MYDVVVYRDGEIVPEDSYFGAYTSRREAISVAKRYVQSLQTENPGSKVYHWGDVYVLGDGLGQNIVYVDVVGVPVRLDKIEKEIGLEVVRDGQLYQVFEVESGTYEVFGTNLRGRFGSIGEVPIDQLEQTMRNIEPDLRKWRKVERTTS